MEWNKVEIDNDKYIVTLDISNRKDYSTIIEI